MSDETTGTPAAHIQTQAPCQEVSEEIDAVEGAVRIHLRSDDITAMVLHEPEDAEALADRLLTAAAEAQQQEAPADD